MNLRKFSNFENWIPASDVDGIDIDRKYVRDITNGDFHNGYITNAKTPTPYSLPSTIQNLITSSGYELLCYKYFYHSVQGATYISVLYKLSGSTHTLKFYVNSTEVLLDENSGSGVTISAKPTVLSYDLIDDQFKINLNVNGTYVSMSDTTILNLTFTYLTARVYLVAGTPVQRSAGWYVFPRWVGWSLGESKVSITYTTEDDTTYSRTCDTDPDGTDHFDVISNFAYGTVMHISAFAGAAGAIGFDNSSTSDGKWGWFTVDELRYVKNISFKWGGNYLGEGYIRLRVGLTNNSITSNPETDASWVELEDELYSSSIDNVLQTFDKDINILVGSNSVLAESSFKLWVGFGIPAKGLASNPFIQLREFTLEALQACIVCKNEDKQRGLIKEEFDLAIFDEPVLNVPIINIDWRVVNYELYVDLGVYTLYSDNLVVDGWATTGGVMKNTFEVVDDFPDTITTLNFNYGLGATARVDNEKLIYREATYRNRTYFVKNDNKLYYSHISGTGLAQPDSFPYSEEDLFGYLITDNDCINKAVCISPLDEVIVITEKSNYIYTIENVSGIPYRKIKAVNGGKGLLSVNSLCTDYNGTALSSILLWTDKWAIYGYAGGRDIPIPITGNTHKNYWRNITGKDTAVTIYNKATDEFWIQLTDIVLIYEIATNTWKKYDLNFTIKDFVGVISNYTYVIGTDNVVYKLDPSATDKMTMTIEFHDDVCFPDTSVGAVDTPQSSVASRPFDSEMQVKVLQDFYVSLKNPETIETNHHGLVEFFVEDFSIGIIKTPMSYKIFTSKTPLCVAYGRIRAKVILPATSMETGLKEFGFWYTFSGILNAISGGILSESGGIPTDDTGAYLKDDAGDILGTLVIGD